MLINFIIILLRKVCANHAYCERREMIDFILSLSMRICYSFHREDQSRSGDFPRNYSQQA